jgi:cation:H+ antiporter
LAVSIVLFACGAVAIWLGGERLPDVGKRLAEALGVSATALGLFVLSIVTSLPELAVTLAAMLREGAPDLALANILGSNNFNVTSVVVLELVTVGVFLHRVEVRRFSRTCLVLLALTVVVGLGVVFGGRLPHVALPVALFTLPIVAVFVFDSATHRKMRGAPARARAVVGRRERSALARRFGLLSLLVVLGGFAIARGANGIAGYEFSLNGTPFALGQTFVGTLLVAIATSMPEVSVAYAAIRKTDSVDIALGTILGSNTVNILVFAVGAPLLLLTRAKSAWAGVSSSNMISVVTALVLTLFVLSGMALRESGRGRVLTRVLNFTAVPVYLLCLFLVYRS